MTMALPWLRLLDAAIGLGDVVRRAKGRGPETDLRQVAVAPSALGGLETRLAGVVVAALKEAFDRDHQRLELERQQIDAERQRAERLLRLERLRQAGDREVGRMRLLAGVALASWLGTLVLAARLLNGPGGRVALGIGWLCLLGALGAAFSEQSRLTRVLAGADDRVTPESITSGGAGGALAPWLVVVGLAAVAMGVLIS
jgi:hypothetical protein